MVIWKQWKRVRTRFANLKKLGISYQTAWEHCNTRKSYWHTAGSPILSVLIPNAQLKKSGYTFFSDYYAQLRPL
jgi:hypothetical protein